MRTIVISFITLLIGLTSGWFIHGYYNNQIAQNSISADQSDVLIEQEQKSESKYYDSVLQPGFGQLKNSRDIDEIRDAYLRLLGGKDDRKVRAAHLFLTNEIQQAITLNDVAYADALLSLLLNENHRDIKALQLKARLRSQTGKLMQALDTLYEAKGYAYSPDDIIEITDTVRLLAKEYEKKLQQSENKYELLKLYNYLTRMEPNYSPYFIKLASMQLLNNDEISARRSLSLVSQDPFVGSQAQTMLNELQPNTPINNDTFSHVADIPLERRSQHFVVNATANEYYETKLLIDTGASLTILTPEQFEALGVYDATPKRIGVFNTANGPVHAPVFTIDSLRIGQWQVNNIDVGVMAMSMDQSIDGLLGMNYLQHFQFFIDQKSSKLRLSN